jgi:hypothetical protein
MLLINNWHALKINQHHISNLCCMQYYWKRSPCAHYTGRWVHDCTALKNYIRVSFWGGCYSSHFKNDWRDLSVPCQSAISLTDPTTKPVSPGITRHLAVSWANNGGAVTYPHGNTGQPLKHCTGVQGGTYQGCPVHMVLPSRWSHHPLWGRSCCWPAWVTKQPRRIGP